MPDLMRPTHSEIPELRALFLEIPAIRSISTIKRRLLTSEAAIYLGPLRLVCSAGEMKCPNMECMQQITMTTVSIEFSHEEALRTLLLRCF